MSMRSSSVHSGEPSPTGVSHTLDGVTTRHIRDLVRGVLAGRAGLVVDDAVLVADELVSNAHRHGEGSRVCRLALINHGRRLRIEVDDAAQAEPTIRTPDHTGGRGLILVDRLASTWGFTHHDDHKTVWAELDLDTPGSSGHAPHLAAARTWHT
jgi:hypothetical protein